MYNDEVEDDHDHDHDDLLGHVLKQGETSGVSSWTLLHNVRILRIKDLAERNIPILGSCQLRYDGVGVVGDDIFIVLAHEALSTYS